MSRRKSRSNGSPSYESVSNVRLQKAGSRVATIVPPAPVILEGPDNARFMTFRDIEPNLTNRPQAISIPLGESVFGWLTNTDTHAEATFVAEASNQRASSMYYTMVDALVRSWENAQLLGVTTIEDLKDYVDKWNRCYGMLRTAVSVINATGFNDRMSQLSRVGNLFRTAIQSNIEAFVQLPMAHGWPLLLDRYFGCFTDDRGSDVIIGENFAPLDVTAADLTNPAVWQAAINDVATDIAAMSSNAAEASIVRQVITGFHGGPPTFKSSGVLRNAGYYNALRLVAMWHDIRVDTVPTSRIVYPYVKLNSVGVPGFLDLDYAVPIIVPNGLEKDPVMATLLRPRVYGIVNGGDVAGNLGQLGLFVGNMLANDATIRAYKLGDTAGTVEILGTPAYDGLTQALSELYWSANAGNESASYASDHRGQEDWHLFSANIATLNSLSQTLMDDIWLRKMTFPLVGGNGEYSASKILR